MQGIVLDGDNRLELETFPDPTPGTDEVVVETKASGMCGSELHTLRGPRRPNPVIAGHKPAGVVIDVGSSASREWLGGRVMSTTSSGAENATSATRGGHSCATRASG